jgi:hypothetical protein
VNTTSTKAKNGDHDLQLASVIAVYAPLPLLVTSALALI